MQGSVPFINCVFVCVCFFYCFSLRISLSPFCYLFLGLQLKCMFFPLSLCYWCFSDFLCANRSPRSLDFEEQAGRKGLPRALLLSGSVGEGVI